MRTCTTNHPTAPEIQIPDLKRAVTLTDPSSATPTGIQRHKANRKPVSFLLDGVSETVSFLGPSRELNLEPGLTKEKFSDPFFVIWSELHGETYLTFSRKDNQWYVGPFLSPEQKLLVTLFDRYPHAPEVCHLAYPDLLNFTVGHYFGPGGEWLERHFEKAFGA